MKALAKGRQTDLAFDRCCSINTKSSYRVFYVSSSASMILVECMLPSARLSKKHCRDGRRMCGREKTCEVERGQHRVYRISGVNLAHSRGGLKGFGKEHLSEDEFMKSDRGDDSL